MQENHSTEEYIPAEYFEVKDDSGFKSKISRFLDSKYFIALLFVLTVLVSFFLGRISGLEAKKVPVRVLSESAKDLVESTGQNQAATVRGIIGAEETNSKTAAQETSEVVGSKNGTKYHYPWCAGAKQISAKNLIIFKSIEEARAKGYTPASNCQGLK